MRPSLILPHAEGEPIQSGVYLEQDRRGECPALVSGVRIYLFRVAVALLEAHIVSG